MNESQINTLLECYPEQRGRTLKVLSKLIELEWEGVNEYYMHWIDFINKENNYA